MNRKMLSFEEFEEKCLYKGINSRIEILNRWKNYLMFMKTTKDGRTRQEVGANINREELED